MPPEAVRFITLAGFDSDVLRLVEHEKDYYGGRSAGSGLALVSAWTAGVVGGT